MLFLRPALTLSSLIVSVFAAPKPHHDGVAPNWDKFSTLLDTVDEKALHQVLHAVYPKFQHGVYNKDRTAIEQVHSENPLMATKLVHIAKRQSSNDTISSTTITTTDAVTAPETTTTSDPAPSTSVVVVTTTPSTAGISTSTSLPPSVVQTSSSAAEAISSVLSSVLSADLTATSLPPPTTVFLSQSLPPSATAIRTDSQGVVYSSGGGVLTLTSQVVYVSFTRITSTRTYYATQSNGQIETRTSVYVVNAPVTASVAASESATPATTSAGLQNGASRAAGGTLAGVVIGALGFLVAL